MIEAVRFTAPPPATQVVISCADGAEWRTDAALPPDTEVRVALHRWLEAGGQIAPYVPPVMPLVEHMAWIKIALDEMGKLQAIDDLVAGLPKSKRLLWEYGTSVKDTDPDVVSIAAIAGVPVSDVFALAAQKRKEAGR